MSCNLIDQETAGCLNECWCFVRQLNFFWIKSAWQAGRLQQAGRWRLLVEAAAGGGCSSATAAFKATWPATVRREKGEELWVQELSWARTSALSDLPLSSLSKLLAAASYLKITPLSSHLPASAYLTLNIEFDISNILQPICFLLNIWAIGTVHHFTVKAYIQNKLSKDTINIHDQNAFGKCNVYF